MTDASAIGPAGHGDFVAVVGARPDAAALRARLGAARGWPSAAGGGEVTMQSLGERAWVALTRGAQLVAGAPGEHGGRDFCLGTFDPPDPVRFDPSRLLPAAAPVPGRGVPEPDAGFGCLRYDAAADCLEIVTDRFRSVPLYVATTPQATVVASDLRLVQATGLVPCRLSLAAVYHFLNFSYVPTPGTMFEGVAKVPPATRVQLSGLASGRLPARRDERWWRATYPESLPWGDVERRAVELRAAVAQAVLRHRPAAPPGQWGAFLSGGTDSSSIAGLLAQGRSEPLHAFSIGFAEAGYDELGYARIAARRYGLESHTSVVSAEDTLELAELLLDAYDEPAGNASSIPTLACARLAASCGMRALVGGDGGDEIFGGNERYRKDAIMERFYRLPGPLKAAARGVAALGAGVDWRPWNRVRNFVRRASLPNPDRFYTDDAFASEYYGSLLSADFRAAVGRDDSLEALRAVYRRAAAPSELHRLMFVDLEMTISDNDIVKVTRAARAAGVHVRFPYLDAELVDYTGRLDHRFKVNGADKRFLFKQAMRDLLPAEILAKKKQGFGLPIGVWLRSHPRFRDLVDDVLLGSRARSRGLFDAARVAALVERHRGGAWDHGPEIWYLLQLELWLRRNVDVAPAAPPASGGAP
jgi:asparagine synthase (glutamine-hydrolysing)